MRLALALALLLLPAESAQAQGVPPQCFAPPSPLQVEVGASSFAGSCFDGDGDALTITITQPPQRGRAEVFGPPGASVQYSATEVGPDSFKFKASDGQSDSNEVTVTTDNVPAVNDPPQCSGPPSLVVEVGNLPSFAGSCFDEEGDALTITITQAPLRGTADVVTDGFPPFTSVRYSATEVGADSFKFKASDGTSDSNEVTVTTDNLPAVNDPPTCGGLQQVPVEVHEPGTGVPCTDAEGDDLELTITRPPQKGELEILDQGTRVPSLRYTATMVGPDSFSYKASDGSSVSNEATTTTVNVDTKAPETTIDAGPGAVTGDSTPTLKFSANEPGSSFECRVDDGSWMPCRSPIRLARLADGDHSFDVRATDQAGHTDASPARRSFLVDTMAPRIKLACKTMRQLGKSVDLVVTAVTEDVWASLSGTLFLPHSSTVFRLTGVHKQFIARGASATLAARLSRDAQRAAMHALHRHHSVKVELFVKAHDAAGNVTVARRTVRLTR